MTIPELRAQPPPLSRDSDGVIRVGGTRVPLERVVYAWKAGESPERIAESFPVLELADVYAAIAFYLRHREEVETYIEEQDREADRVRPARPPGRTLGAADRLGARSRSGRAAGGSSPSRRRDPGSPERRRGARKPRIGSWRPAHPEIAPGTPWPVQASAGLPRATGPRRRWCPDASKAGPPGGAPAALGDLALDGVQSLVGQLHAPDRLQEVASGGSRSQPFLDDLRERLAFSLEPTQRLVGLEVERDRLDRHAWIMHGPDPCRQVRDEGGCVDEVALRVRVSAMMAGSRWHTVSSSLERPETETPPPALDGRRRLGRDARRR